MIELNLTRKDFYRFFLERRFRWGRIPTVGLFTVYLRTVLRTPKKKRSKVFTFGALFLACSKA